MANPKLDPVSFLLQAEMNPDHISFHGAKVDALTAIDDEMGRLTARMNKMIRARQTVARTEDKNE